MWPCRALKSRFRWRSVCLGSGLLAVSAACLDDLVAPSFEDTGNSDPELDQSWWLMNGLYQPTVAMQPGEFQRWRLVTSAVEKGLIVTLHEVSQRRFPPPPPHPFTCAAWRPFSAQRKKKAFPRPFSAAPRPFARAKLGHITWKSVLNSCSDSAMMGGGPTLPHDSPCELLLLSKDGVTVSPAPRAVGTIYLNAASRADVLVRCEAAGEYEIRSTGRAGASLAFGRATQTV